MKENSKTKKGIIIGVVVVLIVAILAVSLYFIFRKREEPTAIMQLETNPGVSLVLDQDNKVIAEVAINSDGEQMLALVSFVGLDAQDAAQKFAETASRMEIMNDGDDLTPNPDKQTVITITISAEDSEKYQNLANKAKEAVNQYFSENGVFAGAIANINNNIKDAIDAWAIDARDSANMTSEELLSYAKTKADELKQVAFSERDRLTERFSTLYNQILATADQALEYAKERLDNAENISDSTRADLQRLYDEALNAYNEAKERLNEQFNEFIRTVQEESKALLESIKASAEEAYAETVNAFNQRVEEFKSEHSAEEITEIQQKIAEFQASLGA